MIKPTNLRATEDRIIVAILWCSTINKLCKMNIGCMDKTSEANRSNKYYEQSCFTFLHFRHSKYIPSLAIETTRHSDLVLP
jgi:hypothetical protein